MRAYVDEVTLRSTPGRGTRVVLDKRIHWEAPLARTACLTLAGSARDAPPGKLALTCG